MADQSNASPLTDEPALNKQGIDAAVMAEYLGSVGASNQCDICGTSGWTVTANIGNATPVIIAQDLSKIGDMMSMPIILLSCNNCGNTKFFSRDFVNNWLAKKGEDQ